MTGIILWSEERDEYPNVPKVKVKVKVLELKSGMANHIDSWHTILASTPMMENALSSQLSTLNCPLISP